MPKLYFSEGCRLCDSVMRQLDELGAKYDAVEVTENEDNTAWLIIDETSPRKGTSISTTIMKGVPALYHLGAIITGYQIGAIIGHYRSVMKKKEKV